MSGYLGLEGKRALVTGGTKGVGQAVVAALREAGATALTTARSQPESFSNAEHFVVADVATVEGCAAVADAVRDCRGGTEIVVHVVGGSQLPSFVLEKTRVRNDWFRGGADKVDTAQAAVRSPKRTGRDLGRVLK